MYLRRATVRRLLERSAAAAVANRDDQSATTWPAAVRRHRCRSKTRRRTLNTRRNRVQFGPPR